MKIDSVKGIHTSARGPNDYIGTRVGQYEYITATFEDYREALDLSVIEQLVARGWRKAWSDSTMEGAYVVFRRKVE